MSATTAAHLPKMYCNYFDQVCYQLKDDKTAQKHLDEEPTSGSKESIKQRIRSKETSSTPYSNGISNREGRPTYKPRQAYFSEERRLHLNPVDRPKRERAIRQGSGFILQSPGLAHVSSDSIDRLIRKRLPTDKSSLRVNTLVLRSHSSPYYKQPLASPTSPTLSPYPLQLSSSSHQETLSPPLPSPLFQNSSSQSQFSSYGNSSATVTDADNFSVFDRKKLSVSSASSVPSILSTHMPTNVANPVVIDWTSPSTRRREYREIDKCNRGFRRAIKTIAPRYCWCKSWKRDFYVGPRGYDEEPYDEVNGKGGDDAGSVRRYRLDLGNDEDDVKNCNEDSVDHDGDFDVVNEGVKDEKSDIVGKKPKGKPKAEGKTFLGALKGRLCRTASKDANSSDVNSVKNLQYDTAMDEKGLTQLAKPEMKEKKQKRTEEKSKKNKNKNKNKVFGEGLICFQLHEIPH